MAVEERIAVCNELIKTLYNLIEILRASRGSCGDRHSFLNNPDGLEAAAEIERLSSDLLRVSTQFNAQMKEQTPKSVPPRSAG